jgi:hypothetical protein
MKSIVCVFILIIFQSCNYTYQFPSISKISTDVVVATGNVPKKAREVKGMGGYQTVNVWIPSQISKNEKLRIWIHGVRINWYTRKRRYVPAADMEVSLEVIDEFGQPTQNAIVEPTVIYTDANGYNLNEIYLRGINTGTYRIRARFKDNDTVGVSYSPQIIVMN